MKFMNFYKKFCHKLKRPHAGLSIIETLIYVALVALILVVITNTLVSLTRSDRAIKAHRAIEESFVSSLDRMVREIRDSISVDATSNLGVNLSVNPGGLVLNSLEYDGDPRVVEFFVENGVIKMKENSVVSGPLMPNSASVANLTFRLLDSGFSKAVRIELTLESGEGADLSRKDVTTTAILRGSY